MLTTFLTPAVATAPRATGAFGRTILSIPFGRQVMSKADILKSFADKPKADSGKQSEAGPVFTAEDILVRPYGDMAALTFRLVEHDPDGKISYFRNSGTFLWRHGKWQAITWQATRVPAQGK